MGALHTVGAAVSGTGFTCQWSRSVPYLGLVICLYRHRCGLEVVSVECSDVENTFIAGFRTPGTDDTGVQHIVEHVVLSGSRHYCVKSPCDEMGRGSLATYINAETYLDRTLYPYSSIHVEEYRHGVDIYLDAVFNPLLREESFMQEGWRYVLSRDAFGHEQLTTSGVVLNERRAQMNDMSDIALGSAYRELFPGHPLSFDSGGTPGVIERLSYDAFLEYYHSHYGVGQARLYFYGDIPTERKLRWVEDYLERCCGGGVDASCNVVNDVAVEFGSTCWTEPRCVSIAVESLEEEDGRVSNGWTLNWGLGRLASVSEAFGMELLGMLLLEDDSSPLRRALLESGLCDDLIDCTGYETEHSECLFVVGVVGCEGKDFGALRDVVLGCLERLSRRGFSARHVSATFKQLRLRYQEIQNGYGLQLGRQIMRNWLSGLDILSGIDYRSCLDELQSVLENDSDFLKTLLNERLLKNNHRVELRLVSDGGLAGRRQSSEAVRLRGILSGMDGERRLALQASLKRLEAFQRKGDSAEALASFPRLKRCELPRVPFNPQVERRVHSNGAVVLRSETVFAGGVNYVKVAYDASMFGLEDQDILPVFACLLDSVGVRGVRYGEFERRLAGAGAELDVDVQLEMIESPSGIPRVALTMKLSGLASTWADGMECLSQRCSSTVFTERTRMRDVLQQCWSQAHQKLFSDDDVLDYVCGRSASGMSVRDSLYERWYGLEGVRVLRQGMREVRGRSTALSERCSRMMDVLSNAVPMVVSYVGDERGYAHVLDWLAGLRGQASGWGSVSSRSIENALYTGRREWLSNGKRGYCCVRSFRACRYGESFWAGLCVYSELLSEGYLLDTIRTSGGAYGGGCSFNPTSGVFQMYSYRDPSPFDTLCVFDSALGRHEAWSDVQITGGIVGCIRGDVPLRASESCSVALARELCGLSDEIRQVRRDALLSVGLRDVLEACDALREFARVGWNDCIAGDVSAAAGRGYTLVSLGR